MSKRAAAVLLALLLTGWPACPPALAEGPPAPPADNETARQEERSEPGSAPGPSPAPQDHGPAVSSPEPAPEPSEEPPPVQETPEPPEGTPPPPEEEGCATIGELAERVARDEGGTISVTGDLALEAGQPVRLEVENPLIIDLGGHGIRLPPGAMLTLSGPIRLTGTGAPRPLVTVEGDVPYCGLYLYWGAELCAEGENAVAVELAGGVLGANGATLRAAGANSCAVQMVGEPSEDYEYGGAYEFALREATLLAEGDGAVCVRAPIPVRLTSCRAESAGALVEAPALTLDATRASPVPEDARVVPRTAIPDIDLCCNGLWIARGAAQEELDNLLLRLMDHRFEYGLIDAEGVEEPWIVVSAMTWTCGPVDLNTPGVTWFTGTPEEEELLGVPLPACRVPVVVADPARPGLASAHIYNDGVCIYFFQAVQGAERVKLWYSLDRGATWQDAGALPEAEFGADFVILPQLPQSNTDYLFRLEVEGGPMAGRSNTLRYPHYDNGWGSGGDWDGGDWGDQGPLPDDDPEPPPDREPEDDPSPEPDDTPPDREEGGDGPDPDSGPVPDSGPDPGVGPSEPAATPTPTSDPWGGTTPPADPAPTPIPDPWGGTAPPADPAPAPTPDPWGGTTLPAVPAPTPTPTPDPWGGAAPPADPAPTPVTEKPALPEGATASLTGRDLEAQKLANPGGVTLTGDGLKVTLPYSLTDALGLGMEGVLAVRLAAPDPSSFEVRVWADGREAADLGGGTFTVSVPVEGAEGTEYFCTAPDGGEIAASALAGGRAEFELTAAGVYTLSAKAPEPGPSPEPRAAAPENPSAPEEPEGQSAPILPLLGAAALAAGGVPLLRRRRGGP